MKQQFVADDGKIFESEILCQQHESTLRASAAVKTRSKEAEPAIAGLFYDARVLSKSDANVLAKNVTALLKAAPDSGRLLGQSITSYYTSVMTDGGASIPRTGPTTPVDATGSGITAPEAPAKKAAVTGKRGRPPGAAAAAKKTAAPTPSAAAPAAGAKRGRGRPPKNTTAAAPAADGKRGRGRPPGSAKKNEAGSTTNEAPVAAPVEPAANEVAAPAVDVTVIPPPTGPVFQPSPPSPPANVAPPAPPLASVIAPPPPIVAGSIPPPPSMAGPGLPIFVTGPPPGPVPSGGVPPPAST